MKEVKHKLHWNVLVTAFIICLMFLATMKLVNNLENDKDVWFHKDVKWNSCSCSTEVPEYFDMCQEFISRCTKVLNEGIQNET